MDIKKEHGAGLQVVNIQYGIMNTVRHNGVCESRPIIDKLIE